ncbi:MAG TPA: ZIP family metal transporter [Bryobacteraceae bacterium]|jgi:zinc transporter ZupT|nr:ZIP family metal transporter [Bryobacteraceae bacterium]
MPVLILASSVALIAVVGVILGVRLSALPALSRRLAPFSGGMLAGIGAFWVAPEMAHSLGWSITLAWVSAGGALIWSIDRFVYPICPLCSHTHDHDACGTRLHGFAGPLLAAAGLHSLLDGWTLAAAQGNDGTPVMAAFVVGMALHKIPEGLALGAIVRAAMTSRRKALVMSGAVEALTIAGAVVETSLAPRLGSAWAHGLLALAAGCFIYLGYHAVHSEYKRRGAAPAVVPALTGVAGSSVIRLFGSRLLGF